MRIGLVASLLLLTATVPAAAQLSVSINIGSYPSFMAVPGYPVYYAPDVGANYFFYDGLFWVYQDDNWYSSSWYDGPWNSVGPMYVPIYILQIPVRYYRRPPQYFSGWQSDRAPRWNDHWGRDWAQRRRDWDRPRDNAHTAPAPLPDYQRRYSGKDYPRADQQQVIRQQNYHYQPQRTGDGRDSGKQPDARRPVSPRPVIQARPAPPQERRAPQQNQHPAASPVPEQPRPPAARRPDNAGAGAEARKSSDPARGQGRNPRSDKGGDSAGKQGQDHKHD